MQLLYHCFLASDILVERPSDRDVCVCVLYTFKRNVFFSLSFILSFWLPKHLLWCIWVWFIFIMILHGVCRHLWKNGFMSFISFARTWPFSFLNLFLPQSPFILSIFINFFMLDSFTMTHKSVFTFLYHIFFLGFKLSEFLLWWWWWFVYVFDFFTDLSSNSWIF